MDRDRILDRFPEILFASYRKQMLLGSVAAQAVEAILEPLLSDFRGIMPLLSPDLQSDFENILRIYPDVAARHSLRMKPPLCAALLALAGHLRNKRRFNSEYLGDRPFPALAAEGQERSSTGRAPSELVAEKRDKRILNVDSSPPSADREKAATHGGASDIAAEGQMEYVPGGVSPEGQAFLRTGKGSSVYLEFSFVEGDYALLFGRLPVETGLDIYLGESLLLSIPAGESEKRVSARSFLEAFGEVSPGRGEGLSLEVLIRVEERE